MTGKLYKSMNGGESFDQVIAELFFYCDFPDASYGFSTEVQCSHQCIIARVIGYLNLYGLRDPLIRRNRNIPGGQRQTIDALLPVQFQCTRVFLPQVIDTNHVDPEVSSGLCPIVPEPDCESNRRECGLDEPYEVGFKLQCGDVGEMVTGLSPGIFRP